MADCLYIYILYRIYIHYIYIQLWFLVCGNLTVHTQDPSQEFPFHYAHSAVCIYQGKTGDVNAVFGRICENSGHDTVCVSNAESVLSALGAMYCSVPRKLCMYTQAISIL